jgi:hypothetical protein
VLDVLFRGLSFNEAYGIIFLYFFLSTKEIAHQNLVWIRIHQNAWIDGFNKYKSATLILPFDRVPVRYLFERAGRGVEIHAPDEAWLLLAEYEQAGGRGGEQRTGAPVSGQLQPSLTGAAVVGGSSHRDTELNTDKLF